MDDERARQLLDREREQTQQQLSQLLGEGEADLNGCERTREHVRFR